MDYKRMTSPCGLDCFNCLMYLASEDEELRERESPGAPASLPNERYARDAAERSGNPIGLIWLKPAASTSASPKGTLTSVINVPTFRATISIRMQIEHPKCLTTPRFSICA
jgi:hypothetical protein